MAKTPEGYVKNQIKKILEKHKMAYSMPMTMGYGKSGWPDFSVVFFGCFLTIEAKYDTRKNPPTALQRERMAAIRKSGGTTLVLDIINYNQLEDLIINCANTDLLFPMGVTPHNLSRSAKSFGLLYEDGVHDK
jgi:hypothetical protein